MPAGLSTTSQPGPSASTASASSGSAAGRCSAEGTKGSISSFVPAAQALALLRGAARRARDAHQTAPEEPPRLGPRDAEGAREEGVEAHALRAGGDFEAGGAHRRRVEARPGEHRLRRDPAPCYASRPCGERMRKRSVELMDTTLRDGEQTPGVAYTPDEKLQLARMLLADVGVDRIEIAGTRVSAGEREGARGASRAGRRARAAPSASRCSATATARPRSTGPPRSACAR